MIESIKELCREHSKMLDSASLITIEETFSNHSDFLIVSFLLDALIKGEEVTFLATRENYAHFLALSKKMGKSIEEFGKNGKLTYFETFVNSLCSELPLTESSPSVYVRVPKFVTLLSRNQLENINIKENSLFIVDSLSFLEYDPSVCYKIYETAVLRNCRIVIGGCSSTGSPSQILNRSSDLWIKLENDVGGHGKFKISSDSSETSLLWKWGQGKFVLSKYMKV